MHFESLLFIIKNLNKNGRWLLLLVTALSGFASVMVIITPVLLSWITERITSKSDPVTTGIYMSGIAYVTVISLQKIVGFLSTFCQSHLRMISISSVSKYYLKNIYHSSPSLRGKSNSGEMSQALSQATNDIYILINAIANSLFPPVIQLIIAVIFILGSGDYFVATAFCIFAIMYSFLNIIISRQLVKSRSLLMESGRKTYGLLVDSVQNIPVVRSFNTFGYFFSRFNSTLIADLKSQRAYWRLNFLNLSIGGILQLCFFGVSFFYTLHNVLIGATPLSHFILISSYLLVLSSPLENLGQAYVDYVQSGNSLKQFLKQNTGVQNNNENGQARLINGIEEVLIENLVFSYPDASFVLGPLTVRFKKGSFTSVTGLNGSGKSTLIKIMTRQLTPTQGYYRLSGLDVKTIDIDSFCENVAYVSQDDYIFRDTIAFNLRIANPTATHEQLLEALRKASLTFNEISDVDNLDKPLADAGHNLSGGQRQKLSLARLFLRNPGLILLDEITASLDVHAELKLLQEVRNTFPEATIINISHRPAGFAISDTVIVLENGKLIEQASPENCQYLRTKSARDLTGQTFQCE